MNPIWWGIFGGMVLAVSLGIRQTFGIFLGPMTGGLGFTIEMFAFTIAIQNLLWGISQPFMGYVADRYGTARVLVIGSISYILGLFVMATASSSFGLMIGGGILIGLAVSACGFSVVLGAVGRITPLAKRSWNLGLTSALGSLGQFAAVPVAYLFINQYGWSLALLLFIPVASTMIINAVMLRGHQVSYNISKNGDFKETLLDAFHNRSFWMINVGFLICGFHIAFIATHLPTYANFCGISSATATTALSLIGLLNIPGSLLAGYLGGHYRKKHLLAGIYFLRAIGIAVFVSFPISGATLVSFAAVIGVLWLATVPLTIGLVGELFGTRYLATLFGIVFLSHQVGAFFGSWVSVPLFRFSGSYDIIWASLEVLAMIAVALHLMVNDNNDELKIVAKASIR